ncbi:MAG: BREX-3 system P-loop-containing protein BrxF [Caldilineaceae bacterium]
MSQPIQDTLRFALQTADGLYHRLVLLVGASGTGKTSVLRAIAEELDIPVINVNLALSAGLLELTAKQRTLHLPELLNNTVAEGQSPVVLDNIEILFDTALQQDPLRLLQGLSRNRTVLASWNGSLHKGKLLYAEPGHPEYRSYEIGETVIVNMDGTTTLQMTQEMIGAGLV